MEHEEEIWGHRFKLVSNGLDPAEVYSFVESLIQQYGSLAKKLDYLDSVAGRLTAHYSDSSGGFERGSEQQAPGDTPRPAAPDLRAPPTNGLGHPLDAERLQNLDALTSFAERTVIEAAKHARLIESEAIDRAKATVNQILADALQQASTQAAWALSQNQPGPPHQNADMYAPPQSHASENLPEQPNPSSDGNAGPAAVDSAPTEESAPESPADETTDQPHPTDLPATASEDGLFEGTVELALPPPVALDRMLQIHKHLKETPSIDVLNLGGSVDNGITIRILLDAPLPLLTILNDLPEADEAVEEMSDTKGTVPSRKSDPQDRVRRVIITAKS